MEAGAAIARQLQSAFKRRARPSSRWAGPAQSERGIEMNQFTAARAEQHRADLMSAAQHARNERAAMTARQRRTPLPQRKWRPAPWIRLAMPRRPRQLPGAT